MKNLYTTMMIACFSSLFLSACGAEGARLAPSADNTGAAAIALANDSNGLSMTVAGKAVAVQSVLVAPAANDQNGVILLFSSRPDACDLIGKNEVPAGSSAVMVELVNQAGTDPTVDPTYSVPGPGHYVDLPNPPEGNSGLFLTGFMLDYDQTCTLQGNAQQSNHAVEMLGTAGLTHLNTTSAVGQVALKSADGTMQIVGGFAQATYCPAMNANTYNAPVNVKGGPTCAP